MTSAVVLPRESRAQNLFGDSGFSQSHGSYGAVPYEHIDPLSGNLTVVVTDLSLPGNGGLGLNVTRSYNSKFHLDFEHNDLTLDERTPVGVGWRLHFGRVLHTQSTAPGQTVIETPDGGGQALYQSVGHGWMSKGFWRYDRNTHTASLPNGLVYTFGYLVPNNGPRGDVRYVTEIRDPFNNRITFEYGGGIAGSVWRVRQYFGPSTYREVLFSYHGNGALNTMTYDGREWRYEYDTAPGAGWSNEWVLRRVVLSAGGGSPSMGLPWEYVYGNNNAGPEMTGIRPPGGGTIDYTYQTLTRVASTLSQPSRVVVTRASGGFRITPGTWTFTYNTGPNQDTTIIDCPCNKTTYTYAGIGLSGNFSAYMSGVLLERTVSEPGPGGALLEREVLTYQQSQPISNSAVTGQGGVWTDPAVYQALVTRRQIWRGTQNWITDYIYDTVNYNDFGRPWRIHVQGDQSVTTDRTFDYAFTPWILTRIATEKIKQGVNERNSSWAFDDATGFMTQANVRGFVTNYTPNAFGQVASATNANNHTTSFTYEWGVLKQTTTPLLTTDRVINQDGTIASETTGAQAAGALTTQYVYDLASRVRKIRPPSWPNVNEIDYEYDNVTSYYVRTARGASWSEQTLDGFGRVVDTKNFLNVTTSVKTRVERDGCGRIIFASAPYTAGAGTRGTATSYDGLGRVKTITGPGTTPSVTTYAYNGADITITDAENHATTYDFDGFSGPDDARLMRVTDATSTITNYQYDVLGNLTNVNGPGPVPQRVWVYNTRGELQSETQPESGTTSYVYDLAGNRTQFTNAAGTTTFSYDANERMTGRDAPGTASDMTVTYDTKGRIQQQTIDGVVTNLTYDAAGRPQSRIDGIHPAMVFTSTYAYDANDNVTTVTYPSGRQISYQYDTAMFRLSGVQNNGTPFAGTFFYDDTGRLQSYYTGAVGHTTLYDDKDRVSEVAAGPGIGHLRLLYAYDKVNNVTTITDARVGAPQTVQTYTYDVLDRMKTANGPWGAIQWGYDPAGNRTTETRGGTTVYNYDGATNRLTSTTGASPESFTWNTLGQLQTNTRGATTTTYGYTPAGMLQTTSGGGVSSSYLYDAEDMRVKRQVNGRTYVTVRSFGGQVISEYETCGGPVVWAKDNVYAGSKLLGAVRATVTLPTISFVSPTLNVAENGGTVNVGVQLVTPNGGPLACDASVTFSLTPGTATPGSDFTPQSGVTVTFPMGTASGTTINRQVTILEDSADEADETFTATLTNAAGALIGTQNAVAATITDNDPAPSLTINNVSVNEASGIATFTVSLSAVSGRQVQVNYATANQSALACTGGNPLICDYTATSGTLTLPASTPSGTINVSLFNNTRAELPETFVVNLSSPVNATLSTSQGTATITDDEVRAPVDQTIEEYVLPDVHSSAGESSYVQIFNPNATATVARLIVTWENGTGTTRDFTIPANQRLDVDLAAQVGIANTGDFTVTVQAPFEPSKWLVVEHSSYTPGFSGGRNEMSITAFPTFYFPEGSVSGFFDEYLTVFNNTNGAVDVTFTFMPTFGAAIVQTHRIHEGPGRLKLRLYDAIGPIGDHSTIVSATVVGTGAPAAIAVERTSQWPLGSVIETASSMGRQHLSTNWYFAEGGKGFWSNYLSVQNPSTTQTANISVAYLHDNGLTYTQTGSVGAMGRTVLTPPAGMPDGGFAMHLTSTNLVPVAAERAMYAGSGWTLGQATRGASAAYTRWMFAEGASNSFFETFYLIANPNFSAATVVLTFRTMSGTVVNTAVLTVPARSRIVVNADTIPALTNTNYATDVNSQNGVSIIVERAMYWPDGNWSGSHVTLGRAQ